MIGISMYRLLLRLYPAPHRRQFGEEMITVFGEIKDRRRFERSGCEDCLLYPRKRRTHC